MKMAKYADNGGGTVEAVRWQPPKRQSTDTAIERFVPMCFLVRRAKADRFSRKLLVATFDEFRVSCDEGDWLVRRENGDVEVYTNRCFEKVFRLAAEAKAA